MDYNLINPSTTTIQTENKVEFNEKNLVITWLHDYHQNKINDLMEIYQDLTGIINNVKLFDDPQNVSII